MDCGCQAEKIVRYSQSFEERPACGGMCFISQKPIKIQNAVDKFTELFKQNGKTVTPKQIENFKQECDKFLTK
jgi:hypothetical protein